MTDNENTNDNEFIRKVLATSADKLFDGLKKDENLTDLEIEAKEKNDDYEWRKLVKGLRAKAACFSLKVGGWITVALLLLLGAIIIRYLYLVSDNPESLASILSNILSFLGGAVTTICLETLVKKK